MSLSIDPSVILSIAREAGEEILKVYHSANFEIEIKNDNSPLTLADKRSNDVIIRRLKELYPDIPIISEESRELPYEMRRDWKACWIVDPLDGTKEFIKRNDEFTVNIAYTENGKPAFGLVYVPVSGVGYYAEVGNAAYKVMPSEEPKVISKGPHYTALNEVRVLASRSHMSSETRGFIDKLTKSGKKVELLNAGSSIKFCLVAEGVADVYPRFGPTMEWDTAAAHAIVKASGGNVLRLDNGEELVYNKESLYSPEFIVS